MGAVTPGLSPGLLQMTRSLTLEAAATTAIEIGGAAPGTEHDRIDLTGTEEATLSGTLSMSLVPGFDPNLGDSFAILTYPARTGDFDHFTVPSPGATPNGCLGWRADAAPTSYALTVIDGIPLAVGDTVEAAHDPSTGMTTLTWAAVPPIGSTYNTYRGTIPPGMPGSRGSGAYDHACLESGDSAGDGHRVSVDSGMPAVGSGFYYVVSGTTDCGEGSLGSSSSGLPMPNLSPCPTP